MLLSQPRLDPEETAVRQVERLSFSTDDVRHIIVTHLDLDHAGGLSDFPLAQVHLLEAEWTAASLTNTMLARYRYHQQQWSHQPRWVRYSLMGERWKGFECVRQLEALPPEILLVPLAGHTHGHTGVAVYTNGRWLLHVGDAYYFRGEMDSHRPHCPLGLALVQRLGAVDNTLRRLNQQRLRQLGAENAQEICIFCAHDPVEFERQVTGSVP
jgi:glyoxylase-like metal-dependent hydrolase (beta-lactamase superfamily II)